MLKETTISDEEQAASHVLTTIPQESLAGKDSRPMLPTSGTQESRMPKSQRLLCVYRIPSAAVQIVMICSAPLGSPTSMVLKGVKPKPSMTSEENCKVVIQLLMIWTSNLGALTFRIGEGMQMKRPMQKISHV